MVVVVVLVLFRVLVLVLVRGSMKYDLESRFAA